MKRPRRWPHTCKDYSDRPALIKRYLDHGLQCPTVGRAGQSAPDADIECPQFAVLVERKIKRVRLLPARQDVVHLPVLGVILRAQGKTRSDVAGDLGAFNVAPPITSRSQR